MLSYAQSIPSSKHNENVEHDEVVRSIAKFIFH